MGRHRSTAMFRPGPVDQVKVVLFDGTVHVNVAEFLDGRRNPMPEKHVFDVHSLEQATHQWVAVKIDSASHQIFSGTPANVSTTAHVSGQGVSKRAHDDSA